jgi:phosphoglycolate phosphatase-like HAD superfamily hydrolase
MHAVILDIDGTLIDSNELDDCDRQVWSDANGLMSLTMNKSARKILRRLALDFNARHH